MIFPYRFREGQKDLYEWIIKNVDKGNLCIQAPTGFGKTPIILSSLLEKGRRIIWVVRTGTETDRPIEELREIVEKKNYDFKGISFRGKKDMCLYVKEKLLDRDLDYDDVSFFCERNRKNCPYYSNLKDFKFIPEKPLLYSEILEYSKRHGICPYYYQRMIIPYMDVLSVNYNYILVEGIKYSLKRLMDFHDSYLVVDEAHNLQFSVMNLNSDRITLNSLKNAVDEIEKIDDERRIDALKTIRSMEIALSSIIGKKREKKIDLDEFLNYISKDEDEIFIKIDNLISLGQKVRSMKIKEGKRPSSSIYHLGKFLSDSIDLNVEGVAFFVSKERKNIIFERWDMRASEALKDLWQEFKSSVFMSGTLEPVDAFSEVIGLKNYKSYKASFNFKPENVESLILKGVSTKGERISREMVGKYKEIVLKFIKNFSDRNIAIFSSSYRIQNEILSLLPEKIESRIFVEREGMGGEESRKILDSFKKCANEDKKGVLFATASGRFAEGADFPGKELEAIMLIGIPFEKLTLKTKTYIEYYEKIYGENKGKYYAYIVPAMRRASQSLGRLIRSQDDKGIFILADERYQKDQYFSLLPDFVKINYRIIDHSSLEEEILKLKKKF